MAPGPLVATHTPTCAGELREPDGLECRHLLVSGLHELWVVACALPGRKQPVDPVAGIPEDLSNVPFP